MVLSMLECYEGIKKDFTVLTLSLLSKLSLSIHRYYLTAPSFYLTDL